MHVGHEWGHHLGNAGVPSPLYLVQPRDMDEAVEDVAIFDSWVSSPQGQAIRLRLWPDSDGIGGQSADIGVVVLPSDSFSGPRRLS
jgi:hypothetical protein